MYSNILQNSMLYWESYCMYRNILKGLRKRWFLIKNWREIDLKGNDWEGVLGTADSRMQDACIPPGNMYSNMYYSNIQSVRGWYEVYPRGVEKF